MNVLFFLEPVIFRGQPAGVAAHFMWVECFRRGAAATKGAFALVSNADVCAAWAQSDYGSGSEKRCYELNAFEILAHFDFERASYSRAVFDELGEDNQLVAELARIRADFKPDLVVMTAQNGLARRAFMGLRTLYIEQAPLPRLGHPLRTAFDPCGHQQGSMLELHAAKIKQLPLRQLTRLAVGGLLQQIEDAAAIADPRGKPAQAALAEIQREGPVALLVTQPTDAVTYEGAYRSVKLEDLIYAWAQMLPEGWIGVPTYHAGQRLSAQMEQALMRSGARLRFLPQDYSQALTEPLILVANGMVTISSSSAMTGLLFRKRVVVTGKSPFNNWCESDPSRLAAAEPLSWNEATSTLAFLTHRFSQRHDLLMNEPARLAALLQVMASNADPAKWLLDIKSWDARAAAGLFTFRACFGRPESLGGDCQREVLEAQLRERVAECESIKAEWTEAVAQRDRLDAEHRHVISEREVFRQEWAAAVADRDRRLRELEAQSTAAAALSSELVRSQADRDRLVADLAMTAVRAETVGRECATALVEVRRLERALDVATQAHEALNAKFELAAEEAEAARRELSAVRLEHQGLLARHASKGLEVERLSQDLAESRAREDELRQRVAAALAAGDEHQARLRESQTRHEALEHALSAERRQGVAERELLLGELAASQAVVQTLRGDLASMASDLQGQRDSLAESEQKSSADIGRLKEALATIDELRARAHRAEHERSLISLELDAARSAQASDMKALSVAKTESGALLEQLQNALIDGQHLRAKWMNAVADHGKAVRQCMQAIAERDRLLTQYVLASDERQALALKVRDHVNAELQAQNHLQMVVQRLAACQKEFDDFRQAILSSRSWRVTAPLRSLIAGPRKWLGHVVISHT